MYYFYVLRSKRNGQFYYGYTNDLQRRVKEHNAGQVDSTSEKKPLVLVYYEAYYAERDARNRERQTKRRAQSYTALKRRIKESIAQTRSG